MTAYSFKRRFVLPIQVGLGLVDRPEITPKQHTIRADRKRHARPGEEVQLYTAMRTKQCELIGRARCTTVEPIEMHFRERRRSDWVRSSTLGKIDRPENLRRFAQSDGFEDWERLREFWREEHPGIDDFVGVIIFWEPKP